MQFRQTFRSAPHCEHVSMRPGFPGSLYSQPQLWQWRVMSAHCSALCSPSQCLEQKPLLRSLRPLHFAAMSWNVLITARTMNETGANALQSLRDAGCNVIIPPRLGPLSEEELLKVLPAADAVLASIDKFTDKVLSSSEAKSLKLISRWGVGYDAINIPAATRNGIVVAYCPGMLNETVADYAFSLMCAVARRVHEGHLVMRGGEWKIPWGHNI